MLGGAAIACYALAEWLLSGRADSLRREFVRATLSHLLYWAILVAYLVLPSVSRSIFKAQQCESFDINVFTGERRSYLVADLDVLCSADDDEFRGLDAYFLGLLRALAGARPASLPRAPALDPLRGASAAIQPPRPSLPLPLARLRPGLPLLGGRRSGPQALPRLAGALHPD